MRKPRTTSTVLPFERWAALPGSRGALPALFLGLGAVAIPIWVGFHSGVVGTLYATIEVGISTLQEGVRTLWRDASRDRARSLRKVGLAWLGGGALLVVLYALLDSPANGTGEPSSLVALITPAAIFTGVLSCGWMSLLNLWSDWRFLPKSLRLHPALVALSVIGGVALTTVGILCAL